MSASSRTLRNVEIFQFGLTFRSVLLLADMGEAPHQARDQFRKFLELAPAPALRNASEAAHALRNVSLKADALLLSVIADVDACRELLLHHMANGLIHFRVHFLCVECFTGLLADQQIRELFVARQAADVSGENAVAAEDHENSDGRYLRRLSGHPCLLLARRRCPASSQK